MPDISKQTVSASQMPALFNRSPYATRFMLHHHFVGDFDMEVAEDERMSAGKRLEPVILKWAADELRCEVLPHDQAQYLRAPSIPVGCTPDGYVFDPQRGLGFIECKNIDWFRWKDTWDERSAADHVELQMQTQLMVPHPEHGAPKWGCIAALVGGNDLKLYERQPIAEVHAGIAEETVRFLADVKAKNEPGVLGAAIEIPALVAVYPKADPEKVLREEDFNLHEGVRVARLIEAYEFAKDRESFSKKESEDLKAKLLAVAGDAAAIMIHGRYLNITKSQIAGRTQTVKPYTMTRMTASIQNLAADLDSILPKAPESELDNLQGFKI